MVSKNQKSRMTEFAAERLEDSKLYNIVRRDNSHIFIAKKPELEETAGEIYIVAHNHKMPVSKLKQLQAQNKEQGIYTAHIFYKDGDNFMVRLGKRGHYKGDDKSLKNYSKEKRDEMIHLRGLEKEVLERYPQELSYYQPKTERLPESIRIFLMHPVELDYSHIGPGDPGYGFVKNSTSIDYKLPEEKATITSNPACVLLSKGHTKRAIISPYQKS